MESEKCHVPDGLIIALINRLGNIIIIIINIIVNFAFQFDARALLKILAALALPLTKLSSPLAVASYWPVELAFMDVSDVSEQSSPFPAKVGKYPHTPLSANTHTPR
ncbi:MAG: hypothetical protein ACR5K7_06085 [Symbiopectobacterium sp.]